MNICCGMVGEITKKYGCRLHRINAEAIDRILASYPNTCFTMQAFSIVAPMSYITIKLRRRCLTRLFHIFRVKRLVLICTTDELSKVKYFVTTKNEKPVVINLDTIRQAVKREAEKQKTAIYQVNLKHVARGVFSEILSQVVGAFIPEILYVKRGIAHIRRSQ